MGVEFDTLTTADLSSSGSRIYYLPDEVGFYGQTFTATSANLSQLEFAVDDYDGTGSVEMTVMIATVRFDGGGFHPDEVVFQSALITINPDADNEGSIISVDTSGLTLVPGQQYVILFNANSGDGPAWDGILTFFSNPQNDAEYFVFNHSTNQDDQQAFDENAWSASPANGGGYGDIAIRLTYDSANVIDGTPGDDRGDTALIGTSGEDIINGYAGNDELIGLGADDELNGGDGHDLLRGNGGNDTLNGGDGDDFLNGNAGDDIIDGGAGYDRATFYTGATAGVTVDLNIVGPQATGQGNDTLTGIENVSGTAYADTLTGDGGDNQLWGSVSTLGDGTPTGSNDDTLDGGGGNDLLTVGIGNHSLTGGTGTDTVGFTENGGVEPGVTVSLELQGAAQATGAGSWTLNGIENLSGGINNDSLTGDGNGNVLAGDQGHDQLNGGGGDDTLYGDGRITTDTHGLGYSGPITTYSDVAALGGVSGNDLLEGGAGNDTLDGGGGIDTASYEHNAGRVDVDLRFGFVDEYAADGVTYLSSDTLANIEDVVGSEYDDVLLGDNGVNTLIGLGGNDAIFGFAGDDTINGGFGNDTLRGDQGNNLGAAGNDTLYGDNGNDFLNGGFGDDYIDGGNGYDRATFFTGATAGVTVDLNLQGVAQNTGQGMDTLVGIENVSGTSFNDVLTGDGGDNQLWGSGATLGDGSISAANNDTLDGGGGNDLLQVGIGNHLLTGGTGIDTVSFTENGNPEPGITVSLELQGIAQATGAGSWTLDGIENLSGGINNDSLTGDGSANVLAGDTGNDNLAGGDGDDTLYGDGRIGIDYGATGTSGPIATFADITAVDPTLVAGDDTLEGGAGNDTLDGGGGFDTASYANSPGRIEVFLGASIGFVDEYAADQVTYLSTDTLYGIEAIIGSAYNDIMTGNAEDNMFDGGDGADFLQGRQGNDTLIGGAGDDLIRAGTGDDVISGGDGFDRLSHYGPDVTGGVTVSLLLQGVAQDTGQGIDILTGIEALSGTRFDDTLIGDDNNNWLTAADGNDTLVGNGGDDLLDLSDGELGSPTGNFAIDGGTGSDTVNFSRITLDPNGVTVSLALQGGAQDSGHGILTLSNVENLSGSQYGDALTGDDNDNVLSGHAGSDNLVGGAGNDSLYGDGALVADYRANGGLSGPITFFSDVTTFDPSLVDGGDMLEGGAGNDTLDGGGGSDTASYANNGGGVEVYLQFGFADEYDADGVTYLSSDTLANIENAIGSAYDDLLMGNNGDNVLEGLGGNDNIIGNAGNDTVDGGEGNDTLRGDQGNNAGLAGNDTLYGGNGNDFLNGGFGDDTIDGGSGYDRATFYTGATGGVTVDLNLLGIAQNTGQGMDTLVGIENVSGTFFADTLIGDGGDNHLWGSPATLGDGSISADNNDTLDGGGGNDLLTVGIGNHSLTGGSGSDTVSFTENGNPEPGLTVSLELQGVAQATGAGNWTLNGIENLSGGINNDSLTGDDNDNVLAGDTGNDHLAGGDGNDTLYGDGRTGIDFFGGPGTAGPITTWADVTTIDPSLVAGDDTLEGGLGDDTIDGGGGSDTASYASASGGVQAFLYDATFGEAFGAAGYDQLYNMENLTGSAFDDQLFGNGLSNVLSGGDGHDFIQARGGDDTVYGGNGDDYLGGGTGNDLLDGGAGFDRASFSNGSTGPVTVDLRIQGVAQNTGLGMDTLIDIESASGTAFGDTFIGNSGDNWLWGGSDGTGNDTIDGREGNDLIEDGAGDHVLSGGDGIDTFRYSAFTTTSGIAISLALQGAVQNTGVGMMTLTGFENLSGAQFADTLTGDGGDNVLAGSEGGDTLVGGSGNDTLYGDGLIAPDTHGGGGSGPITTYADVAAIGGVDGNDLLEGGLGNDTLNGGGGIDTATYAHATGSVNVNLGTGLAFGADGNDTLSNIENLTGSEFGDTLNGSAVDNLIEGLGGNDVIQGQGGNDTINGGEGDDTLRGDAQELSLAVSGDDIIHGGNGNDGLRGGLGNDQLYGDAGNDLLRGNGGVDYFDGGADDGEGFNGIGDRVSFFDARATQGAVADLRTGVISNDGFGNVETMVGIESLGADTAYVDTFYGNDARNFIGGGRGDYLYGFGDNDAFQMGSAAAVVDGGSGIDTLGLDSSGGWLTPDADADGLAESAAAAIAGWTVNLGAGTLLDGYGNSGSVIGIENVNGSQLGDTITGDANVNVLNGGDGDDTLQGGLGNDTIDGGNNTDTASYANASGSVTVTLTALGGSSSGADGVDNLISIENVTGSAFNDTLTGNGLVNLIQGGDGHDTIRGGAGNDTLEGGAGDDFLRGDDGDDILRGGTGFDRVGYASSLVGVTVNLTIVGPQATGQGNDTFEGIENVSGTQFNDVITGDGGDNWLWGGSNGAGVTGNDTINGGGGNDLIEVGAGTHTLNGGAGTGDTLSLFGNGSDITSAGITYSLALQGAAQNTEQGMMNTSGFENVSGSIHADFIYGNTGNNTLAGDLGNDTLRGEDGNDILYGDGRTLVDTHGTGGSGPITTWHDISTVTGDPGGNDTLLGGRGDDYLFGGRGDDTMTGNQGVDRFVIEGDSGDDIVTDFAVNVDKITFSGVAGVDDFSDLTLTRVGNNTVISWGTSDSITLTGLRPTQLHASDFEFGAPALLSIADSGARASGASFELTGLHEEQAMSVDSYSLIG